MSEWWSGLSNYQHVLFVIAAATTLFMIVQLISLFIGMGMEDGFDTNTDSSDGSDLANDEGILNLFGLKVLSSRSIVAFFCIGAWITFAMDPVMPWYFSTLIGVACGCAASLLVAFFMKSVSKMQSSGNLEIVNAVGKKAEVYLSIPANRGGMGKVNFFMQERLVEMDAVTDNDAPLMTGSFAEVVGFVNDGTVIVK